MMYIGRDGTERWFSVSAAPLLLEPDTGYEDEVLLVLNDITEQRQQQERFQEQARLASVGQLASGVAHEINNPLAAIYGYSELLQMADLPPQATQDARNIQRAAERAAKIVQNLLSFAGKSEPEKRYLNVAAVVDQALALKARDFELENIRVTTKHSKGIPSTMVDESQIIQVILNILTNAEQAIKTGRGHGQVTISTRMVKGFIGIRVSDDGPGIPAEHLHSIFDPFFTTKEVGEETGLGLSICYGIVRDQGGKMWAESAPGKRATFHIELPVLPDVAPTVGQSTETDGVTVTARRILVVDDEPEVRHILGRVLSADGHDVSLASDGQEAWKLIQKTRFDNIFLDLRMPGVDGQELYQQIIEYSLDLAMKVVFITGDSAKADTERFLESTSSPVLGKPFTIEAIRQLL